MVIVLVSLVNGGGILGSKIKVLTSMNAEYPIVDDNGQRQKVKHVREVRPDVRRAILPHTFCIEPIRLLDGYEKASVR